MWVKRRSYVRKHPEPSDVLLLIEVAESSLDADRGEKLELYAEALIAEYWIVNLVDQVIEVYRQPQGQSFQSCRVFRVGDTIAPLALPQALLPVEHLFPT